MNSVRIQKLIKAIDVIIEEESEKPILIPGEGCERVVEMGKLAAVQDILKALSKK